MLVSGSWRSQRRAAQREPGAGQTAASSHPPAAPRTPVDPDAGPPRDVDGRTAIASTHRPGRRERSAVRTEDMVLISIDDHSIEPPDMYERHVPARWRDQAPKIVRGENG